MTICDRLDTVVVLFPFTDIARAKPRPALVLSRRSFNENHGATVLAMITTAGQSKWPSDVALAELVAAGLTRPSFVRLRIFTLENDLIAKRIGALGRSDRKTVEGALAACLGTA